MSISPGRVVPFVAAAALALVLSPTVRADEGGDDVRRVGTCSGRGELTLRLRADEGRIEIRAELERLRPGSAWSVIVLRERRIVTRVSRRAGAGGRVEVRRTVADWAGPDTVVVRASGPAGQSCRVTATIQE